MAPTHNTLARALAASVLMASCTPDAVTNRDQAAASAESAPQRVGDCAETTVASVGSRLENAPESGSSIAYANGLGQVDYAVVPGIANSRSGDQVRLCLASVPENCPPGDNRGRVYAATNLRTGETWSAPDSQHMCGGA